MNSWGQADIASDDLFEEYSNMDFLVIDDFGFNDEGPKMKIIQKILFMRHENDKPTFITSNLLQDECLELMGDRVKSRFLGNLYKSLTVNFADYRLKDFDHDMQLKI
jgi:DNA replication protein DnaC